MVENRLRWFEHIERKHIDYVVRRATRWRIVILLEAEEGLEKLSEELLGMIWKLMSWTEI
jgi:hypothetical protein